MVGLTDRPDMTLNVNRGRKTTIQQHKLNISFASLIKGGVASLMRMQSSLLRLISGYLPILMCAKHPELFKALLA